MKLTANELYKLFVKRRFAFLLAFILIAEFAGLCVSVNKSAGTDKDSRAVYKQYMSQFGGELTEDKQNEIDAAIEEWYSFEGDRAALVIRFEDGEITAEEYKSLANELKEKVKGSDGFFKFVTAYESAKDDSHYLSDVTVWNALFSNGGIDFFMVITVILLVVAVSVYDEETGVNKLRFSSKKGKGELISVQIATVVVLSFAISAVILFGKLLAAVALFGLDGFSNPLYSAEFFAYSEWNVSLLQAYIYLSLIKIAGAVYLALTVFTLGQIFRSSLYTVFFGMLAVYIPAYSLTGFYSRYLIPIPSSLLSAVGYFSAAEEGGLLSDEAGNITAEAFSAGQLAAVFTVCAVIMLVLIIANRLMWTKRRNVN